MAHQYPGMTAWLPISHEMRETVRELGSDAIERLREFGLDDRREAAFTLILAGAAPLAGMLLLGWEPMAAVTSLLLNLIITQVEDIWKFLRAAQPWPEVKRECVQDEFVWPVAVQMALGSRRVYGKTLPTLEDVDAGKAETSWWVMLMLSVLVVGFVLFMLQGSGAVFGQGKEVAFGSLPNALAGLVLAVFHGARHDAHSSRAASVRLQNVSRTAMLTYFLVGAPFLAVTLPPDPWDTEGIAVFSCVAVVLYGIFRLNRVGRLARTAKWLERWLAREVQLRAAKASILPVA